MKGILLCIPVYDYLSKMKFESKILQSAEKTISVTINKDFP